MQFVVARPLAAKFGVVVLCNTVVAALHVYCWLVVLCCRRRHWPRTQLKRRNRRSEPFTAMERCGACLGGSPYT